MSEFKIVNIDTDNQVIGVSIGSTNIFPRLYPELDRDPIMMIGVSTTTNVAVGHSYVSSNNTFIDLTPKITDNEKWDRLRMVRNRIIAESDWMANSDVTMTDAWKTYRQALRDLPSNTSDPDNPTWPTPPS